MAVKVVIPPQFATTKPGPPGKPDGHQTNPFPSPPVITMRDWIRQDQDNKESQPTAQYS